MYPSGWSRNKPFPTQHVGPIHRSLYPGTVCIYSSDAFSQYWKRALLTRTRNATSTTPWLPDTGAVCKRRACSPQSRGHGVLEVSRAAAGRRQWWGRGQSCWCWGTLKSLWLDENNRRSPWRGRKPSCISLFLSLTLPVRKLQRSHQSPQTISSLCLDLVPCCSSVSSRQGSPWTLAGAGPILGDLLSPLPALQFCVPHTGLCLLAPAHGRLPYWGTSSDWEGAKGKQGEWGTDRLRAWHGLQQHHTGRESAQLSVSFLQPQDPSTKAVSDSASTHIFVFCSTVDYSTKPQANCCLKVPSRLCTPGLNRSRLHPHLLLCHLCGAVGSPSSLHVCMPLTPSLSHTHFEMKPVRYYAGGKQRL